MEPIRNLDQLVETLKGQPSRRVAVAAGHDPNSIQAAAKAVTEDIATVTLVGDEALIRELCAEHDIDPGLFTIVDEADEKEATAIACGLVKRGEADVLMKGLVGTEKYVRQILNKETGLLPKGEVLTHICACDLPEYQKTQGKLLFVSDVAIIPAPDLATKIKLLNYCVKAAKSFGVEMPKAAMVTATEKVSHKIESTTDGAIIAKMAERGQIKGAIVDGPLSLDGAISAESCERKGIKSPIQGDADILIFPNLESGNAFYKACNFLANGRVAAVLAGTSAPCVLTSRADSDESKFLSIALGCRLAG